MLNDKQILIAGFQRSQKHSYRRICTAFILYNGYLGKSSFAVAPYMRSTIKIPYQNPILLISFTTTTSPKLKHSSRMIERNNIAVPASYANLKSFYRAIFTYLFTSPYYLLHFLPLCRQVGRYGENPAVCLLSDNLHHGKVPIPGCIVTRESHFCLLSQKIINAYRCDIHEEMDVMDR